MLIKSGLLLLTLLFTIKASNCTFFNVTQSKITINDVTRILPHKQLNLTKEIHSLNASLINLVLNDVVIVDKDLSTLCKDNYWASKVNEIIFVRVAGIPRFKKEFFENCPHLRTFIIKAPLYTYSAEFEEDAFSKASKLKKLKLDWVSTLFRLNKATLKGLNELETLDITNSTVEHIDADAFDELKMLKNLNLEDDHIQEILPGTFKNLARLTTLSLLGNPIQNFTWDLLRGANQLEDLEMSDIIEPELIHIPTIDKTLGGSLLKISIRTKNCGSYKSSDAKIKVVVTNSKGRRC